MQRVALQVFFYFHLLRFPFCMIQLHSNLIGMSGYWKPHCQSRGPNANSQTVYVFILAPLVLPSLCISSSHTHIYTHTRVYTHSMEDLNISRRAWLRTEIDLILNQDGELGSGSLAALPPSLQLQPAAITLVHEKKKKSSKISSEIHYSFSS